MTEMYSYYRSTCHSTAIQKILRGSLSAQNATEIIFIKGSSIQVLTVTPSATANDINLLTSEFEQPVFGTVGDARLMRCQFSDVSTENQDEILLDDSDSISDEPFVLKTRPGHPTIRGQDVVAAVSEYGKLVFWTLTTAEDSNSLSQTGRFETLAELTLDTPGLEYTKVGKSLAIDPFSRVIAVSSYQDRLDVLIMSEAMSRTCFDPVAGMGTVIEEGIIWHMEFLYTHTDSPDRILLALVVYNDVERICRMVIYAINTSNPHSVGIERIGRLPLDRNTPLPVLLIPLECLPETFMLVTEQHVCVLTADDIACGNVMYPSSPLPRKSNETFYPLFTAYSLPTDPTEKYIYLGTEDGRIYHLDISSLEDMKWTLVAQVNPIGQSMCVISAMTMTQKDGSELPVDVIVYSGEGVDSQAIAVNHLKLDQIVSSDFIYQDNSVVIQTFTNRAPLMDYHVMHDEIAKQDKLITCAGQGKNGAVNVISQGYQATSITDPSPGWERFTNMWSGIVNIDGIETHCLTVSFMSCTKVLAAQNGDLVEITNQVCAKDDIKTVFSDTFIINQAPMMIQIYDEAILISRCGNNIDYDQCLIWTPKELGLLNNYAIRFATLWKNEREEITVTLCLDYGEKYFLQSLLILQQDERIFIQPCGNIEIQMEPCCLELITIGDPTNLRRVLVVGTFETLLNFYIVKDSAINLLHSENLALSPAEKFAVPGSISLIGSFDNTSNTQHLLVGLRQGTLLCYTLNPYDMILINSPPIVRKLGLSAVYLVPTRSCDHVFARSNALWKIEINPGSLFSFVIEKVLLPAFEFISSIVIFDAGLALGWSSQAEMIAVVADQQFHIFKLAESSRPNVQRISLGETPRKVLYDDAKKYAMVITTARNRKPGLQLVDTSSGKLLGKTHMLLSDKSYDRDTIVLSTAEWKVPHRGRAYKYLCVGMGHLRDSPAFSRAQSSEDKPRSSTTGSLHLYRIKETFRSDTSALGNQPMYTLHPVWNQDGLSEGVYAICPHSEGLLFSTGNVLHLYHLDPVKGRLVEITRKTSRSFITSINVIGDRICVTSHTESISFYIFNRQTNQLEFSKSDPISRSIHHLLMVNSRIAIGMNYSGGMVALFDDPDDKSFEQRLVKLFSFHYPDIIIRPSFGTLKATSLFYHSQERLAGHILAWTEGFDPNEPCHTEPIFGCTIAGGIVTIYRISPSLYALLFALQNQLLRYGPTSPLLGSWRDFCKWYSRLSGGEYHAIHGDLISLYMRLSSREQRILVESNSTGDILCSVQPFLNSSDLVALSSQFDQSQSDIVAGVLRKLVQELECYC